MKSMIINILYMSYSNKTCNVLKTSYHKINLYFLIDLAYRTYDRGRFKSVVTLLQLVGRRETTAATGPRIAGRADGTYGEIK